jgi:WD40 repeat protein
VVDQFEELLTHTPPAQRARLAGLLCPALTGPVRVVATLRPEFLDQLLADSVLAALPTGIFALRPLGREALRLAIEGPARLAGITVEADLVARLVEDTGSGEALPLLAFTLSELAESLSRGGQLSANRYEQLGGVRGALIRQADIALAEAGGATGRASEEVIAGLLRLVTVDEQGAPTRWRVRRDELPGPVVPELDAFVGRRLLSTGTDNGVVMIGVAHEAFLSAWPPLAQVIAANVTALRARRAIEHAAAEWHAHKRPPARLWAGDQLTAAAAEIGARIELDAVAREFLRIGLRRDSRRRRRTRVVLSVLLILALIFAGVAFDRQRNAQQRQRVATASQLVGQAEAARSTDLRTALLLGLAAHRLDPTEETYATLAATLIAGPYLSTLTRHSGAVKAIAFTRDGRTLATASDDNTVILWDLADPSRPRPLRRPLTGHVKRVKAVAFSPDGRTLATGSADNTAILWDISNRAAARPLGPPLTGHTGPVTALALTPDSHTLITGGADHTVIRWDLTDRARPRQLGSPLILSQPPMGFPPSITRSLDTVLALAPDGRTLATLGAGSGFPILWDMTDPAQPHQIGRPLINVGPGPITAAAFGPGGRTLATSGSEGTILWDLTDPAQPRPLGPHLIGHRSPVNAVAFSPDGRTLASGGEDRTVILWDVTNPAAPRPLGPPLTGHSNLIWPLAFAPNGRTLATGSFDGTVILWDLANPAQPRRLGSPLAGNVSPAFAPDGRTLATGSAEGTVTLCDLTDPTKPHQLAPPLTGHTGLVTSLAFSPDGRTLATAALDGTVILWDLADRSSPAVSAHP